MEKQQKRPLEFAEEQEKSIKKMVKNTVKVMNQLGTYKPEFDPVIFIYARMRAEYEYISTEYLNSRYQYDELTDSGASKKAPIITTLESYRRDILAYASQLGLTPSGLKKINDNSLNSLRGKSKIDEFLEQFPD